MPQPDPDTGDTTVETIWIIGASDGIGAALAHVWAAPGVRLFLSARSNDKLTALAGELPGDVRALPVDITDRTSLDAAAAEIRQTGPLDRIVHLAAIYDPGRVDHVDPDKAAQIVTTNLTGTFNVARLAPGLLRSGGQLALCGSVAGYLGLPQGQIYSATKAAVINLAETLRAELAGVVDVRLISPGFVDTQLTRQNDFRMPAMITPETAAARIKSGLTGRGFEIHFPRRLTLVLKLMRALPYWASMPLTRRLVR